MSYIIDIFTQLGSHFWLIIAGCIEALIAVILIGTANTRTVFKKRSLPVDSEAEIFLREIKKRNDEINIVVRRTDYMPIYEAGNLEEMFGVTLKDLQDDVKCLGNAVKDKEAAAAAWKSYMKWDGDAFEPIDMRLDNNKWVRMMVIRSDDGRYDIITFVDITSVYEMIKRYEDRLQEAYDASQSKTTFLSRMSHEIRTPMNGIIGMLTLAKGKLEPQDAVMQYLDKAGELSDHMLSLINDILDMSRIEAGKVELVNNPLSIHELGTKLYDMFAKNLESRGIRYSVDYENMTVDKVIGDELRISQVIINFLSNAVKFTSEGEVSVTFRQMMLKDGIMDLMVRVHDTGIGMDPEFIKRIFRPFEQESIETSKKYGGTGLGMAITDQIVNLMGGEIVVESLKGEGSDFFVYLHLPVVEGSVWEDDESHEAEESSDSVNVFEGKRILMAEDNEVNAMIATEILGSLGAEVEVAGNGQIAVDMFKDSEAGYYDIIFMDIQMPVMDGRSAARAIRRIDRTDAKTIPMFALSADAFVEDERLSIESGMNGHFAKPLDFTLIQKQISEYYKERRDTSDELR